MDGGGTDIRQIGVTGATLDRLMPMHMALSADGRVTSVGPTLRKLYGAVPIGASFFDLFELRHLGTIASMAGLRDRFGERLTLNRPGQRDMPLRGIAMPMSDGASVVINLSLGALLHVAVPKFHLTDSDFAVTDLAMELLFLVEAKVAMMEELRQLNLRLQGARDRAQEQAFTDTLTGLGNRRAFDAALARERGSPQGFALMHLDLDFFKAVNDTLGHAAGDHVLREVAAVLRKETRNIDMVARVGGDEFVLILAGVTDPATLERVAARIIRQLEVPIGFDGESCRISGSIGITTSDQYPDRNTDQMQSDADTALYVSKKAGRGRATVFLAAR